MTFTRYRDGDGTEEEEEGEDGKRKELGILVNVKVSLLKRRLGGVELLHSFLNLAQQEGERSASRH